MEKCNQEKDDLNKRDYQELAAYFEEMARPFEEDEPAIRDPHICPECGQKLEPAQEITDDAKLSSAAQSVTRD
jgi:hypothetical protein